MNNKIRILGDKIAEARFKRKFLPKISKSLINNPNIAAQICRHAEMELLWNPIGFKAGATNKSMWKKLKAKKPFFSYLYEESTYKNQGKMPFQSNLIGAELEVALFRRRCLVDQGSGAVNHLPRFRFYCLAPDAP